MNKFTIIMTSAWLVFRLTVLMLAILTWVAIILTAIFDPSALKTVGDGILNF